MTKKTATVTLTKEELRLLQKLLEDAYYECSELIVQSIIISIETKVDLAHEEVR